MSGEVECGSVVSSLPDTMLPLSAVMHLAEKVDHRLFPFGLYAVGPTDLVVSLIYIRSDEQILSVGYSPEDKQWQRIETHPPGTTVSETVDSSVEWLREEFGDDASDLDYLDIERIFSEVFDGQNGDTQ